MLTLLFESTLAFITRFVLRNMIDGQLTLAEGPIMSITSASRFRQDTPLAGLLSRKLLLFES